ncbi:hypothetical protein [Persicitalea jodogahamensis]
MAFLSFFVMTNCKKDKVEITDGLKKVFNSGFAAGEIAECRYDGILVYTASPNAYDAGSNIYDKNGNPIGTCNYAWGSVDSLCRQLKDCEVVYRVKGFLTGQPPVDKYKLGK